METEPTKHLILVVEDDPDISRIISVSLERQGYAVALAFDAISALKSLGDTLPTLIITDVMMPGMDGLQLVKMLKEDERTSNIPVLMMSARTTLSDVLAGEEAGADLYFKKPFSTTELVRAVKDALANASSAQQVVADDESAGEK